MKHVLTLLLIACSCIVSAQSEYCLDGTVWDAALGGCVPEADQCDLQYDFNGDGSVGAEDLLMFLTGFGATIADSDLDGVCDEIDDCVGVVDDCGICNGSGAIYECGCADIPEGDCDCLGSQLDAIGECGGDCLNDVNNDGICDDDSVFGCTDPLAINFLDDANVDDGSCCFFIPGPATPCGEECTGDADEDGVCDNLEVYGCLTEGACNYVYYATESAPCDFLSCAGCTDEMACNYWGGAILDDGTCQYPDPFYDCSGACLNDSNANGICDELEPADCGLPVSYQGYDYATVLIVEQCWFAENLRSENYENGDAIPLGFSDTEWTSTTSGATAVYGEGSSDCYTYTPDGDACDEAWSLNEYGRVYNWYAVDDVRGLCPSGWHVPTDGEWMTMEMALGMSESEANSSGWRGWNQGTQMKTTYGWYNGGNGTNSSGFSGLPGGGRNGSVGYFKFAGVNGNWWSSSPQGGSAWFRGLNNDRENVARAYGNPREGYSVRCVRDAE